MKKMFFLIAAGVLALGSCSDEPTAGRTGADSGADAPEIVDETSGAVSMIEAYSDFTDAEKAANRLINNYTYTLMGPVAEATRASGNFAFSPVTEAINMVMMAHAGNDELRGRVADVFGADDFATISDVASTLRLSLPQSSNESYLSLATGIFLDSRLVVRDEYTASMKAAFDATVERALLSDPASVQLINDWCSQATNGMIREMVDYDGIKDCAAVWLSSLYFHGLWQKPFDRSLTRDADFMTPDGKVTVAMMHNDSIEDENYASVDGFTYLRFRFNKMSWFTVVMPPAGMSLTDAAAGLDGGFMSRLRGAADTRCEVRLDMPRFECESAIDFTGIYSRMGLSTEDLDLLAIGLAQSPELRLIQKSSIRLDEDGAEAASVSGTSIVWSAFEEPEIKEYSVTLDRPFFYFIENAYSGTCVYAGCVARP